MKCVAALALLLVASLPLGAQEAAQPPPVHTLDRALEYVFWDPARSGPLLVVDPAKTALTADSGPLPNPHPRDGYNLRLLVPHFARKIVPLRTLTVLAPTTMVVINTRPGKPDLLTAAKPEERMRLLMASLSPAQWRRLGSAEGLGMGDLTPEQRPVFLSLLPDPFVLREVTVENKGYSHGGDNAPDVTFPPERRAAVRLRLNLTTQMYFSHANNPSSGVGISGNLSAPIGSKRWIIKSPDSPDAAGRPEQYGMVLQWEAPNRLKPGHLPFDADALAVAVSLENVGTVAELLQRVALGTEIELHADRRVGKLPCGREGGWRARAISSEHSALPSPGPFARSPRQPAPLSTF